MENVVIGEQNANAPAEPKFCLALQNRFRGGRACGNVYVIVRVDAGRSQIVGTFGSDESAARAVLSALAFVAGQS